MNKPLLVVLVPFVLVATVALGLYCWDRGAFPGFRPTIVDVAVQDISRKNRGVRVRGTAHLSVRIQQKTADGSVVWHLFPLLPEGDLEARDVRAVVRTTRAPGALYAYEDMTVEGLARPPGSLVPQPAREALRNSGYFLTDDFVLIDAFDD